jgi:hypothetical protein
MPLEALGWQRLREELGTQAWMQDHPTNEQIQYDAMETKVWCLRGQGTPQALPEGAEVRLEGCGVELEESAVLSSGEPGLLGIASLRVDDSRVEAPRRRLCYDTRLAGSTGCSPHE